MDDIIEQKLGQKDSTNGESQAMVEILDWSKQIPEWQQDALRRICQKGELDDTDIEELAILCKHNGKNSMPIDSQHLRNPEATTSVVNLSEIRDTWNVNALKPGEHLTFCKTGLTVVYGDNGSGKSGYVRILKQVCRSRSSRKEREILPNIHVNDPTQQKAIIRYSINGENKSEHWRAKTPADQSLSAISVFDSDAANVHVEEENEVAYTPFPIRALEELAKACKEVKNIITTEIQNLDQQTPATIKNPKCSPSTAVGKILRELSCESDKVQVHNLAEFSEDDNLRLTELNHDLHNDPKLLAGEAQVHKRQLEEFNSSLKILYDSVSEDRICHITELFRSYQIAKEAAYIAANNLFNNEPIPEIGTKVWRELWETARTYSKEIVYPDSPFPFVGNGARCVLCQQELSEDAKLRLVRFEKFVKDDTKQKEEKALKEFEAELKVVKKINISAREILTFVRLVRKQLNDEELALEIRCCAAKLRLRRRRILRDQEADFSTLLPIVKTLPTDGIYRHINSLSERINLLLKDDESEERKKIHLEYEELSDRKYLAKIQEDVLKEIDRRSERSKLDSVLTDTTTNHITNKNGKLTERLITEALHDQFLKELDGLVKKDLKIELRKMTRKGIPRFFINFIGNTDKQTKMILSEGEHRCVALAAFLAEILTSQGRSAIVFDDPVSSLDHRYQEAVANRLAIEAQSRQVIVFTHDIVFLTSLLHACKKTQASLMFRCVCRTSEYTGIVNKELPIKTQKIDKKIKGLQSFLNDTKILYETGNDTKWEEKVYSLMNQLRQAWEFAVEEVMEPVIKRMSYEVKVSEFDKLTVFTTQDSDIMREAYGFCSKFVHSSPSAANTSILTPKEIQQQITLLRYWLQNIIKRQKSKSKYKNSKEVEN